MPIFKYPEARVYKIHKMLYHITRDNTLKDRFTANPEAVMNEFGLSEQDKAILKTGDPVKMFEYGISPYMIFYLVWQIQGRVFKPPEEQVLYKPAAKPS